MIDKKLEENETKLDEFEKKIGLPSAIKFNEAEVEKYLSMGRDDLEALKPEDCGQIAYILASFGYNLQCAANKEQSKITWATANISGIIHPVLNQYNAYSYKEKFECAVMDNSAALKLRSIQIESQQRLDRLSFLSHSIKSLCETLKNIQMAKQNARNI